MKKLFFTVSGILLLFCSCIQNNEQQHNCPVYVPENTVALTTKYISVYPSDWEEFDQPLERYSYATFELEDITKTVLDYGAVMAYLIGATDNPLPYVFPLETEAGDTIMHNYRFDLEEKAITFILESSDMDIYLPQDTIQFKVSVFSPN